MRWAERRATAARSWSSTPAQTIISNLLTSAGVPYVSIGGDNTTLGTVESVALGKRNPYISLIEEIDEPWLCKTFDWLPDGTVRRMQVTELPTAWPKWQYAYPGNVLSIDNPATVKTVKNRVEVKGAGRRGVLPARGLALRGPRSRRHSRGIERPDRDHHRGRCRGAAARCPPSTGSRER